METKPVKVEIDGEDSFFVQANVESVEYDVSLTDLGISFDEISQPILSIARGLKSSLEKIKPNKTTVEFGLKIGAESGKLTALVVQGTSEANLKITLEWTQNQ